MRKKLKELHDWMQTKEGNDVTLFVSGFALGGAVIFCSATMFYLFGKKSGEAFAYADFCAALIKEASERGLTIPNT